MTQETEISIALVAAADEIFRPHRAPMSPLNGIVHEHRRMFRSIGLPWSSRLILPGAGEAERQKLDTIIGGLAKRGTILIKRRAGQRVDSLKLTDTGDSATRALCHLPQISELRRILNAMLDAPCFRGHGPNVGYIPEIAFLGESNWDSTVEQGARLFQLELDLLPALVRGFVQANSDAEKRGWYRLTPEGIAALKSPRRCFKRAGKVRPSMAAREVYMERRKQAREQLERERNEIPQELGDIPLPVSGLGMIE